MSPHRRSLVPLLALAACHHGAPPAASTRDAGWTDARIAGVAMLANSVEIGYASIAMTRATDRDVRRYAARMHTDHTSLNATLAELLARRDIAPADDRASSALRDSSAARRAAVASASPRAFDAGYLDHDIRSHRELLAVVDQLRAANPSDAELRELVAAMRPTLLAHLAHAEQVRSTLAARRR